MSIYLNENNTLTPIAKDKSAIHTETMETIGGTASKAYSVGEYFIGTDGLMYKVTAAIASGGTITENTNCVKTSVEEELGGSYENVGTLTNLNTTTKTDLVAAINEVNGNTIASLGTNIPADSDLNDYTTKGVYCISTNADASNIANVPIAKAAKIIVTSIGAENIINQFYITYWIEGFSRIYKRSANIDDEPISWSTWDTYVNAKDVGALSAITGKSILPSWSYTTNTRTSNGLTATFNPSTGEITINGTASADTVFIIAGKSVSGSYTIPKGTYTLSGCPSDGATTKYGIILDLVGGGKIDYGSGTTFTLSADSVNNNNQHFYIIVKSGQTLSNKVFKPMLRPAFTTDTFEPCEDIHKGNCYIGTCTTAAGTKDKVAYVDGYFVLRKGARVAIKFSNTNTYANTTSAPITLNVNDTGAKNIGIGNTHTGEGYEGYVSPLYFGRANNYRYYVYDGSSWVWDGKNSVTLAELGIGYGYCNSASNVVNAIVTSGGYEKNTGYITIRFVNDVPRLATLNINDTGASYIFYRGRGLHAGEILAGDTCTFQYNGSNYILVSNDRWGTELNHNVPRNTPKDITAYVTDGSLWKRLNGTDGYSLFEDIFVGDYIEMSRAITTPNQASQSADTGSQYVTIAGIDTYLGNGDGGDSVAAINYHHLVMVPGQGFGGKQYFGRNRMNATASSTGGYISSELNTAIIGAVTSTGSTASGATINEQLFAEFGSHLKTIREILSNSVSNDGYNRAGILALKGASNGYQWTSCQALLMSEIEVYGSIVWSSSGYDTGCACTQLPLFAFSKEARNNRTGLYWLKDVVSVAQFCVCGNVGNASISNADTTNVSVRPRFILA